MVASMHDQEIERFALTPYEARLKEASRPCLRGAPVLSERAAGGSSFCGGLPRVDPDFQWPEKEGCPLNFVAQIACREVPHWPREDGYLLFFYDNRHWGSSSSDRGHAVVIWQLGEQEYPKEKLPEGQTSGLFGLFKKKITVETYRRLELEFQPSLSYPSLERQRLGLADEAAQECYAEFLEELATEVQIGGYPHPIQSDEMEAECAEATGTEGPWELLMQFAEVGNMSWGDAGALYWFLPAGDLQRWRFDRAWMVSQCH